MPTIYKSSKTFKPERRKKLKKIALKSATVLDVVKSAEKAHRFRLQEEKFPDMPAFTKKRKRQIRKAKKQARGIIETY